MNIQEKCILPVSTHLMLDPGIQPPLQSNRIPYDVYAAMTTAKMISADISSNDSPYPGQKPPDIDGNIFTDHIVDKLRTSFDDS